MDGTTVFLWLSVLLNQLLYCPADADQDLSTTQQYWYQTEHQEVDQGTNDSTNSPDTNTNGTRGDCLMDTEMGLIAIGTAGGLIICLLVVIVVLAYLVCHIQRQVYIPRNSRSNMDLACSEGYWNINQPEVKGLVGPCDASVVLEELREDSKMEEDEQAEIRDEGVLATSFDPDEKNCLMLSSSSRDSCLDVPKDLGNMALVV